VIAMVARVKLQVTVTTQACQIDGGFDEPAKARSKDIS
jgi:hypothetical protein